VRLTDRGRRAVEEAIGAQNALESRWFSVLAEAEQDAVLEMLERVLARIERPDGDVPQG
jgi:DNA-binding MarR family transcriptional regulator